MLVSTSKNIKIIPHSLSDHVGMTLELNMMINHRNYINSWGTLLKTDFSHEHDAEIRN